MDEIIQIKCPFCGALLSVRYFPGIESRYVTCPVDKQKHLFTEYKRVTQKAMAQDAETQYPGQDDVTSYNGVWNANKVNFTLGKIQVVGGNEVFQLQPSTNVIGRKAQKSSANFQIDTHGERGMSREHIVIDVKKVPDKGFVHYLSLFKERVNPTYINNKPLLYGDCVVLNDGATIKLPDATLIFTIPDDDETKTGIS